jgi:LysR family transcriptional activator of dmlA
MSLTPAGELYYAHIARIQAQIDEVEQLVSSSRSPPKGLIRVNASLSFGRRHIGPALAAFYTVYPEVEIQLEISDHPLDLASHGFDVGIRFGTLPDAALHTRKIASNRRLPCAPPLYIEKYGTPKKYLTCKPIIAFSFARRNRLMACGASITADEWRVSRFEGC